ncbi:MAG: hypothetical protein KC444_09960 [Nitrosopumilus sp.]|nr:hypothetical protein [Nitrosopumilus sp.]
MRQSFNCEFGYRDDHVSDNKDAIKTNQINLTPTNSNKTPQKTGRKPRHESKKMQETLKELFFESGMTPYHAAKKAGVDFKTAQTYFREFAKDLVDDPDREDWVDREQRVIAVALEGYSTEITKIRKLVNVFDKLLMSAIKKKDDAKIDRYERHLRNNRLVLYDLVDKFNTLGVIPPSKVVLEAEIERRISEGVRFGRINK